MAALSCMVCVLPAQAAPDGAALFAGSCALCHQARGAGSPGLAPPLADRSLWKGLGPDAAAYIAGVMLGGLSGTLEVGGVKYVGLVMPPQDRMSDEELAAIGNYVLDVLNDSTVRLRVVDVTRLRSSRLTHAQLREMRRARRVAG